MLAGGMWLLLATLVLAAWIHVVSGPHYGEPRIQVIAFCMMWAILFLAATAGVLSTAYIMKLAGGM